MSINKQIRVFETELVRLEALLKAGQKANDPMLMQMDLNKLVKAALNLGVSEMEKSPVWNVRLRKSHA